ncbi:MAG TPA: alpha/beta fold hydrolase [Egibacteraceae bacterium]|nr:alpha/beta fold hydrolase [Egibacteraceae bacterium]
MATFPQEPTAAIEDTLIRIGRANASYTLVFLHGFAMHADPYAAPIADIVGDDGEALLYDLPGHGDAPGRVTSRTLAALFDSIAADLADGRGPIVLAGESMGCTHLHALAARLATDGRQVRGFILLAPPLLLNPLTLARWTIDALLRSPGQVLANRIPVRRPIAECVSDPQQRRALLADPEVKLRVDVQYLARSVFDIAQLGPQLRRMAVPTMLLQGSRDPLILPLSLALAYRLCGADDKQKVMIQGARHSLLWDVRTGEVTSRVRAWLSRLVA